MEWKVAGLMYMRMREREAEPIPGELTDAIHLY